MRLNMENAAKALEIAAGVLLAVIILSLIAYFFSTVGEWPTQEDDIETAEQLSKFNLEYEVYEKSAMYGVDVISCLNKAKSNNEKYVEGGAFLSGSRYGDEYTVNVYISIGNDNKADDKEKGYLEEQIEVYYFDQETHQEKERRQEDSSAEFNALTPPTNFSRLPASIKEMMDRTKYYTEFSETDLLVTQTKTLKDSSRYMVPGGGTKTVDLEGGTQKKYYSLLDEKNNTNSPLMRLINFSANNPKITIKNTDPQTYRYWSTIIWTTALYDFKTKRFTCDNIIYSETTGRVTEIYFSELVNN